MIGFISISPADYGTLIAITGHSIKRMRRLREFFMWLGAPCSD
jgi:hypothetical protein